MVMLKVISLALLFLVRLRFPVDKSIAYVLRSRYGNTVVKDIRKFEKIDYALRKCKLDLLFLEACLENQVIPKFLNFRVNNLHLKTSRAYHACQLKLLREEISFKRSRMKSLEKDFNTRKRNLRKIKSQKRRKYQFSWSTNESRITNNKKFTYISSYKCFVTIRSNSSSVSNKFSYLKEHL